MKILAIETSCDETAAAVIENGTNILSNVVVSQVDIFAAYGGVIPEVAARSHLEAMLPVINQALEDAHLTWDNIDAIAVTHTPGLLGSLLIGTLTARTLAILHHKPLYPIHHLKSHIYANWLTAGNRVATSSQPQKVSPNNFDNISTKVSGTAIPELSCPTQSGDMSKLSRRERQVGKKLPPAFPLLALVISGGHTQIIYMPSHNHFQIIGTTRDDAIGECFDKVAKILGLPYPGGPAIAKAAQQGDPNKYHFPHPKVPDLDFSFSGLKTAVLRAVQQAAGKPISFPSHELAPLLAKQQVADFAASFQKTAADILIEKLQKAQKALPNTKSLVFAGGVSANQALRQAAQQTFCGPRAPQLFFPDPKFSGDNAAMVGAAAFYEIQSGIQPTDPYHLDISPRSPIQ